MKTREVLDKYSKVVAGLLNCDPKDISFYRDNTLIGTLDYYKTEDQAMAYAKEQNIPFRMEDYVYCKNNFALGRYVVKCKSQTVSTWKLYEMPHCCAFMVSCNVTVEKEFRNKRVGTVLNQLRQDIGRLLGYSSIICTDTEQNKYQRQLLKTNGWKDIHDVINKRTKNRVFISIIDI